jgi:hypothetical protein
MHWSAVAFVLLFAGGQGEPRLEDVERLVGDWEEVGSDGKPTGTIVSSYRPTAAGTAILETVFPGTKHEMVTLYREEGGALVLTHYCVSGNQPEFRAERTAPNQIVYRMTAISNLDQKSEPHMRQGTVTWLGEDSIETEWLEYRGDQVTYTARYQLARRKNP